VLHNLLLAEGLPLTTRITEVLAGRLYLAADVAIFLGAVSGIELADTLTKLKTSSNPPVYLTVYAPWITDDNFLQNIKTQAESLGYSGDKLRLRG
jgi:adenine-specific DNA-methyltransferase